MKYLSLIIFTLAIGISCSQNSKDENAQAMGGAYVALLDKYTHLMDSVKSDSSYRALVENKKIDLKMLLEQYQGESSTAQLEIIRSQILIDLKEYENAISKLDKVIEQGKSLADFARFQKVRALQASDEMAAALTLFHTIDSELEINDQYLEMLINFAFEAPELSEQELFSRELLEMDRWPQNDLSMKSYIYRNLALIELQKGNTEEAKMILEQGISSLKEAGQTKSLESTMQLMNLIGEPAPELFAETWLNSQPLKLKDLRGKAVVIDFWATWCSPCRAVIPSLVETYEQHKSAGLVVLGYTRLYGSYRDDQKRLGPVEPKDEIRLTGEFLKRFKMTYPVAIAHNKDGFDDYFVNGIPTLVFIDKQGIVKGFKIGSGNEQYVAEQIRKLLETPEAS
ncbi:MAG: redoxin domain-containing protein [bacterium]|nr:MAG: redoxin domain-containing protein [bacterium]